MIPTPEERAADTAAVLFNLGLLPHDADDVDASTEALGQAAELLAAAFTDCEHAILRATLIGREPAPVGEPGAGRAAHRDGGTASEERPGKQNPAPGTLTSNPDGTLTYRHESRTDSRS